MFEIEKGIEIPQPKGNRKYPWKEMKVGDSFFLKGGGHSTIYPAASYAGTRNNKKFVVRAVEGGIRVWRIE